MTYVWKEKCFSKPRNDETKTKSGSISKTRTYIFLKNQKQDDTFQKLRDFCSRETLVLIEPDRLNC